MKELVIKTLAQMIIGRDESEDYCREEFVIKLEMKREKEGFKCKRCGTCCLTTDHVDLCLEDIVRWEKAGRKDLYTPEMIIEWDFFGASGLFRNQTTSRCPFLRKVRGKDEYYCKIHDIKPLLCRQFPRDREHAKKLGCPGYD